MEIKQMLLKNKTAVVYAAAGAVGETVARAFAREGARVFLTGRSLEKLNSVAEKISADGFNAEVAEVDALDEQAVVRHLEWVVEKTGGIDVSFNAIGIPQTGIEGISLTELTTEKFLLPSAIYLKSHFITARAAARLMIQKQSGAILFHTPDPARLAARLNGGMAAAWASIESLSRNLSAELATRGIRTITVRSTALPETETIKTVFGMHAKALGVPFEQFQGMVESMNHTKRLTTLEELGNAMVFAASDGSKGMTGAVLNLTGGKIAD